MGYLGMPKYVFFLLLVTAWQPFKTYVKSITSLPVPSTFPGICAVAALAGSQPVNPILGGAPTTSCLERLQTPSSLTVDTCILSPVLKMFASFT